MTEQNGGGVALFDFDLDDHLDIFLVNGSNFDRPAQVVGASNCLYRAVGRLQYEEVARLAGLQAYGFGMGCTAGDYDNDGFSDLFVAYYGPNRLWHNNGDGTFAEVSADAGVSDARWASSTAFADLDDDGNLDLYVVNYVEYLPTDPPCYTQHTPPVQILCGPQGRPAQPDLLYRNRGDGRFDDVSQRAGIALVNGKGLGLTICDFDENGRLDIYVTNDTTENYLFRNQGRMSFQEAGLTQAVALSDQGSAHASMGIGCADYNGDGHIDLYVANYEGETNDFYENRGAQGFCVSSSRLGLGSLSRPVLGFGTILCDFDLDHWPDVFVANGHVWDLTSLGVGYRYEMPPHLLRNDQGQRFLEVSEQAGEYFRESWLGRAAAFGDMDNDGDSDLVVSHLRRPAALLRNDSQLAGGSLRLELIGKRSARQPAGARIEIVVAGNRWVTQVSAGGSFQACNDPRAVMATGQAQTVDEILVRWSHGSCERWTGLGARGGLCLVEGSGLAINLSPH